MTVTRATDLWDQISPELLRQMVQVFANAGEGVLIVPEAESAKREEEK